MAAIVPFQRPEPPPSSDDVRAAVAAFDLVSFVQRDGVPLVRAGRAYWTACCPFHPDDTPSFRVYSDPAPGWYCYGCRQGGDAITYVALRLDADPRRDFGRLLGVLGLAPGPRPALPPLPPQRPPPEAAALAAGGADGGV
jgi:DNA primase